MEGIRELPQYWTANSMIAKLGAATERVGLIVSAFDILWRFALILYGLRSIFSDGALFPISVPRFELLLTWGHPHRHSCCLRAFSFCGVSNCWGCRVRGPARYWATIILHMFAFPALECTEICILVKIVLFPGAKRASGPDLCHILGADHRHPLNTSTTCQRLRHTPTGTYAF
jgi:hypothetical protein